MEFQSDNAPCSPASALNDCVSGAEGTFFPIKVDEQDTDERTLNLQTSNNLARSSIEEE